MLASRVMSRFGLCWLLMFVANSFTPGLVVAAPPALDEERLRHVAGVFEAFESKWEWAALADDGEKVLPYVERLLTTPPNDRVAFRALIFARTQLSKFDCKSLIDPTLEHLKNHTWDMRAEAMMLLQVIGSREDCPAVAMLLHGEFRRNRIGVAEVFASHGGRRELFTLDHWLSVRAADANAERGEDEKRPGYEDIDAKSSFEHVKKARDALRERLEKEAKGKPTEPTEADKVVAKFADADAKVRAAAVEALKKVGTRADSTAVVALLHDPDATVRAAAADWLGAVGGKRELVALDIRIREPKASDDAAFDAIAKARRAVADRVEADDKKLKAKSPDAKDDKKPEKK